MLVTRRKYEKLKFALKIAGERESALEYELEEQLAAKDKLIAALREECEAWQKGCLSSWDKTLKRKEIEKEMEEDE